MAIPVRLKGWNLPHKAPESHYSLRKGTRKSETSHCYSLSLCDERKEVGDGKVRIVGQALPPAKMEWFDRQECLSYNCGAWFLVVN